jgi:hypothetical protein
MLTRLRLPEVWKHLDVVRLRVLRACRRLACWWGWHKWKYLGRLDESNDSGERFVWYVAQCRACCKRDYTGGRVGFWFRFAERISRPGG